jgi:GT2 family glycosyltransferase
MISVVIVNYKMKKLIKNCVQWIKDAKWEIPFEIIVVDNDSQENAEEYLKKFHPEIRYIQNAVNVGMGGGTNVGIRAAKGDYVLVMNPDIFVFPGTIEKLYNYLETNEQVGIVAPQLLNPDASIQYSCYAWHGPLTPAYRRTFLGKLPWAKKDLARFLMTDWDHQNTREVDWIQGSCWLVPKKVFNEIGMFDDRFFMYFEDTDFCRRVWQSGRKVVYFPDAQVVHLHRRQSADKAGLRSLFSPLTREHIKSWRKYISKYKIQSIKHKTNIK